jgi:hypothetical protein
VFILKPTNLIVICCKSQLETNHEHTSSFPPTERMQFTIDHEFLKFDCPRNPRIGAETVEYYRKIKKNMKHIFYIQQPPRQIVYFPRNFFSF